MLCILFFLTLWVVNNVSSKQIELETFLKNNPKIYQKIKDCNVEPTNVQSAYKMCAKAENQNFIDDTPFKIENEDICKGRVSIVIAIHSNNPNSLRRQIIRETYGSVRRIGSLTVKLIFFVGRSVDNIDQIELMKENEINGDIVQRDFIESYRNMTRKHLSVMEWITKHCSNAKYLLKTDDDVFVDLYHVVREISSGRVEKGFLCSSTKNSHPQRSSKGPQNKWYVTKEEYSGNSYPTYCEGYGYILPIVYVPQLFTCSLFNNFFWIDDVHVGGVLPELLGIPRQDFSPGGGAFFMVPSHASHKILDGIFYVAYYSEFVQHQWRKMWRAVIEYSMTLY